MVITRESSVGGVPLSVTVCGTSEEMVAACGRDVAGRCVPGEESIHLFMRRSADDPNTVAHEAGHLLFTWVAMHGDWRAILEQREGDNYDRGRADEEACNILGDAVDAILDAFEEFDAAG